ncbi:hypothetical protein Ddye_020251 [Dipteronia dyeriana]|uniref:RNase H type-1 domain-containing protein n=1 Tax=Dipteronia dyeriana TaxID=168575 RepID=A0AAD9TZE5_9ROSI|nr:hypothetical protein Ddye_020251 [Dipteronia dyeriana]
MISKRQKRSISDLRVTWMIDRFKKAPDQDYYMVNCSAVVDMGGCKIGISILIRNSKGAVMASCEQPMDANFDGPGADIMAVYKGVLFSLDCGLNPCVFESDMAVVVANILKGRPLRQILVTFWKKLLS